MKAIAIKTSNHSSGNAIKFSAIDGKSPALFLEFISTGFKIGKIEKIGDYFVAHFYPSVMTNRECASYINANN